MSLILNIDTAIDIAHISVAKDGEVLAEVSNTDPKAHGSFLQPAIQSLLKNACVTIHELDAIAISAGPGSYTGLRVGMASAKGLCYALNKPLISISTLEILASSAIWDSRQQALPPSTLFCPMIDARRMEVFTALYDQKLQIVLAPCAMVLDENSFANGLLKNHILFFGKGIKKWQSVCQNPNAIFRPVSNNSLAMSKLAAQKFEQKDFANLYYSEPLYLKEFFDNNSKN